MLLVAPVAESRRIPMTPEQQQLFGIEKLKVPRSEIPAATHVDYSARIQSVHRETNPRYHALISAFRDRTGCPVIVNTSFNVRGEPIVCTPEDAFRCFMGTHMEALAIGNCFLEKADQDSSRAVDYTREFNQTEDMPPSVIQSARTEAGRRFPATVGDQAMTGVVGRFHNLYCVAGGTLHKHPTIGLWERLQGTPPIVYLPIGWISRPGG
jgi:hypothetical protein